MNQIIETRLETDTTLVAGALIPFGTVEHKQGCSLSAGGTALKVKGSGYYMVTANVTLAPTAAQNITVTLNNNGVPIAKAIETPSAAGSVVNLTLIGIVYNPCGCANDTLTLAVDSACTVNASNVVVERK